MHRLKQEKTDTKEIYNGNDLVEREFTTRLVCTTCNETVKENIKHATIGVDFQLLRNVEIEHNFDYLNKQMERIYRLTGFSVFMEK